MKKKLIYSLTIILLASLLGCKEDEEEAQANLSITENHVMIENYVLDAYKQFQNVVKDSTWALISTSKDIKKIHTHCAEITVFSGDTISYDDSLVIDYGDSYCQGINDYSHKGMIIAGFNGKYNDSLTQVTLFFQKYSVQQVSLSGSMIVVCNGTSNGAPSDSIYTSNLAISANGNNHSWNASYKIKSISGNDSGFPDIGDDLYEITGSANGNDGSQGNKNYSVEIVIPLNYQLGCRNIKEGLSELSYSNNSIRAIDYGSGNCDNTIKVTVDGKDYNISID